MKKCAELRDGVRSIGHRSLVIEVVSKQNEALARPAKCGSALELSTRIKRSAASTGAMHSAALQSGRAERNSCRPVVREIQAEWKITLSAAADIEARLPFSLFKSDRGATVVLPQCMRGSL